MTWPLTFHILDINHRTFRPYFLINKSLKVESKQEVKNLNCNSLKTRKKKANWQTSSPLKKLDSRFIFIILCTIDKPLHIK